MQSRQLARQSRYAYKMLKPTKACYTSVLLTIIMRPSQYIDRVDVDVQQIENSVQ